ncbi:adenosylmethionine--8-amino-7-oxononanoate transaminase [Shewanella intestini]|uniref:Adenosylmethionine-8-amino-7-oxononanoate aminotransferase n=1 Tax=Shewanella intestini TaxID=2017544 RepID=A0ABS5HYY5_9GAMM|nr:MULTISPECIES: adenosylmethionine--8-amino-7-oxononanoate transaminase [Shewanella]MBR9726999.1 adenosylmethionine--8-amino-7-oxononanoate transaminase [Shewanella intestini]MRG35800.1 adenosylmethionine--8-amino-7-oxononanoate transaminase [Shewanella sp. XMDDZSB0408]
MNSDNLPQLTTEIDFEFDQQHIWHPYTSMTLPVSVTGVTSAKGCELTLSNGDTVIDGTSSWWACVHGYHHPDIIEAMQTQLSTLSHVMFGGLTHAPAINVCKRLVDVTSANLTKVFLADSGSISVEVAIKMAIQYWQGKQHVQVGGQQVRTQNKQRILTVKGGYHGDTFATMSICDPDNGMHTMFGDTLIKQLFAPTPTSAFGDTVSAQDTQALEAILQNHHQDIAAFIIEPIMQGAGGMHFYSAEYLKAVRALCDKYQVLLILDEIATGFGRTGKLFAYEHAGIEADILCLGKALTGGYISLAATMCTDEVALGISQSPAGVFMHGPTFMANPLACAAAEASIALLQKGNWQQQVNAIAQQMQQELEPARQFARVKDVRVLGAVGVIEMECAINISALQQAFIELGVWIRPFGHVIYITPPYIITSKQLTALTQAMKTIIKNMTIEQAAGNTHSNG